MNVLELFAKIRTFIFDVDGVLTDGTVLVLENQLQARRMHIRDGFALQVAVQNGYRVKIISGGASPEVTARLARLGVEDVSMSVLDKRSFVRNFISENNLKKEEILFMGDDLPDIGAMAESGLACCPADAADEVKQAAQYISPRKGGDACVRDVIEKVLKINDHWNYQPGIASK